MTDKQLDLNEEDFRHSFESLNGIGNDTEKHIAVMLNCIFERLLHLEEVANAR